jgi:ZIP family zinc transporter
MASTGSAIAQASLLVSFPVAAAIIGSVVSVLRPPGPKLTSAVQHFAAGVVLAALAGEILPDLRHEGNLGWAVAGFTGGTAVMLALGALGRKLESKPKNAASNVPPGLLIAVGIDLLLDGLLVGLSSTLGSKQGSILTIALTIEILFIGLSVATSLNHTGLGRRRSVLISSSLGLSTALGAILGAALLAGASSAILALVLAFGAAALLYLVVEELLTEAHEQEETTLLGATFFLGFLTIYILGEL